MPGTHYNDGCSGRGAVRLARCNGVAKAVGSNPTAPTIKNRLNFRRFLYFQPAGQLTEPHERFGLLVDGIVLLVGFLEAFKKLFINAQVFVPGAVELGAAA